MKTVLRSLGEEQEVTHEGFHLGATILVVLLFILFMGTSFYLMATNY